MHACMHVHTNTCLVEREIERGGGVDPFVLFCSISNGPSRK